jgi:phage terminase small subunit
MAKKLSVKQKNFCDAYIRNGGNATAAAITAGYTEKSADTTASKLLNENEFVAEYLKKRFEELEIAEIMKEKEILKNFSKMAKGELREEEETIVEDYVTNGKGYLPTKTVKTKTMKSEGLRRLGDYYGMFKKVVDLNANVEINVSYDDEL